MQKVWNVIVTAATVIAAGAALHCANAAEATPSEVGVVTVFDHTKLDALFGAALAKGGSAPLWDRTSPSGTTSDVSMHSRESTKSACPAQGCSHKNYTAVVVVTSGSATLVVGGTAKAPVATDKFGGMKVQGGSERRIGQGDVFIMPPDTIHWYHDVTPPFRYIEVPVP